MSTPDNACGNCRACCRLLGVQELDKPELKPCRHASRERGCAIYATRPHGCQVYECLWLQTQRTEFPFHPALRPDRSGVLFEEPLNNPELIIARVNPGQIERLQEEKVKILIEFLIREYKKKVVIRYQMKTSNPVSLVAEERR